jgi:hypothetical protein
MGFLIRTALWLSIVLLIIPIGGSDEGDVGAFQAFFAARAAVEDMVGICERQPQVCETGRAAFDTIASRAREGARLAHAWLGEFGNDAEQPSMLAGEGDADDVVFTGGIPVPSAPGRSEEVH